MYRRLQYIALFSIGLLLIAIAIVRLPYYTSSTAQVNRNTWGSVEEFFAAFVANVPTLFTLRKDPYKEREAEAAASTSSARARPRFTPNQFHDTDLFETNVPLGTVTVVEGDGGENGRGRGRSRGRSRGDSALKAQASEENLIPEGKFDGRGR